MKVIIAGGRDFNDYELLKENCNHYLSTQSNIEVVSGCAKGADNLGQKWALEYGYCIMKFPADWNKFGKRAGPIRNDVMAAYADALIAFWDGKSTGTKDMIKKAYDKGLKVKIVNY